MVELPSGTVTFLFTDVEGSTRMWEEHPGAMRPVLARHDEMVRVAIAEHHGHVVKTTGDGFHCVFASAHECLRAAAKAQAAIEAERWPDDLRLRVRMGVHSGEAEERDGDYYGPAANRAARLMGVAHGGQIVVSGATGGIVADTLEEGLELVALGEHRLRDVATPVMVFQLLGPGLAREFPPLVASASFVGNLPTAVSSFVGREHDVAEIVQLLGEVRTVTLTGVGGVGKTRLALEVAVRAAAGFRDGAWLVELARLRDPEAVADAILAALRAPNRPDLAPVDALGEFLATKELLLVLDNCEHLLSGVAEVVRALLPQCARLVVLATSREGLAIRGERIVAVPSLDRDAGAELFVQRARDAQSGFDPIPSEFDAIRELCRRLDGIPLAIELAAARVPTLSPTQIADRLDRRFRLLAGGERGAVERHATLRAAIDWSYDMLSPAEQALLGRLSVFAGSCTLDAAEAVCADGPLEADDVLDLVSSLVARSLVVAQTRGSDPTYRLLETIRQYAEERIEPDDVVATRDRHSAYYAAFMTRASPGLQGSGQLDWLRRVDREVENIRVAVTWALERERADDAVEMLCAAAKMPLCFLAAARPVIDQAEAVVAIARRAGSERLANVVAMSAWSASLRGETVLAEARCAEAEALCGDPDDPAMLDVMAARVGLAVISRDIVAAGAQQESMVEWARRRGTPYELAAYLAGLAAQRVGAGQAELAVDNATEALTIARAVGASELALPDALGSLALAVLDHDPAASRAALVEADEVLGRLSDVPVGDVALMLMAIVAARLGEELLTLRIVDRAFRQTLVSPLNQAVVTECLGAALAPRWPAHAATLLGAVDALIPGLAEVGPMAVTRAYSTETIDAALGADEIAVLRAQGAAMTATEASEFAGRCIDEALAADT